MSHNLVNKDGAGQSSDQATEASRAVSATLLRRTNLRKGTQPEAKHHTSHAQTERPTPFSTASPRPATARLTDITQAAATSRILI